MNSPALQAAQGMNEKKEESNEGKIFEFRRNLKQLKKFEQQLKKEAEDFDEKDWSNFEKSIKPQSVTEMLESANEKRAMREQVEADKKRELRAKIFEKINFDKIGKL